MKKALHVIAAVVALFLATGVSNAQTKEPTVNGTLDVISEQGNLVVGQDIPWQAIINSFDREGELANLEIKLHNPAQSENFTLQYNSNREATTEDEAVYSVVTFEDGVATIGPEGGEALPEAYQEYFKINFSAPGIYTYDLILRREDGNPLASVTETVTVGTVAGMDDMIGDTRVAVYPTVSQGMVKLSLGSIRNADVAVMDILGRNVLHLRNANGTVEINTQHYARGTYFVKVMTEGDVASSRLIVR
ncbi:T9SS type A sorting domain-containing protein [Pontibacter anaerobius]|uniref:T9SS type A sorting domain-containing protein n=1 Tax=Pontibacter anaerobius TaxID=2993940 RepID=A0ABT3R9H9_9BACT|nr:T9SS type A sorting domain-containing protein [Pontibacter anaerobius]MCX2738350.1 T9SS type A sorting domain-containing protein [Pontibacter anaerobius]